MCDMTEPHPDRDTLTRFLLERSGVRGVVVHLDQTWREIAGRTEYRCRSRRAWAKPAPPPRCSPATRRSTAA